MIDSKKYNISVPRYTSYPTVPFWEPEKFTQEGYESTIKEAFLANNEEVSLYIHLPYCESLCTYCACNTRITKNHAVEDTYMEHLLMEWDMYLERLPSKPTIREVHLGGGTPTFFSSENLEMMIEGILKKSNVSLEAQMSFEGHPSNTTSDHLKTLYNLGFERLSLGIQDFDKEVQILINRDQSFEEVQSIVNEAREIGYKSINFDMVYGLPGQNVESLKSTIEQVNSLAPERIAFYSYAHVPSLKPAQRSFEKHLPNAKEKLQFKELGESMLKMRGYHEVGMDHFVLPEDELLIAQQNGKLHRNFMGYTTVGSRLMIGLGVSSISDSWTGFAQNDKTIPSYFKSIDKGDLPIIKGHLLTSEDLFLRVQILNLMCNFTTSWNEEEWVRYGKFVNTQFLEELSEVGFITLQDNGISILPQGKEIVRVICSAMDARLNQSNRSQQFSKAI